QVGCRHGYLRLHHQEPLSAKYWAALVQMHIALHLFGPGLALISTVGVGVEDRGLSAQASHRGSRCSVDRPAAFDSARSSLPEDRARAERSHKIGPRHIG